MAKMMGPRFKKCRSLGLNFTGHPKAMNRYKQGDGRGDGKLSNYGMQLLEKQRLRAYYGVMEKQMRNYAEKAFKSGEQPGEFLIRSLEMRLDNVVYRMGFANSIRQARQMVVHGHMTVNEKKVNIPSYRVSIGDVIALKERASEKSLFRENFEKAPEQTYPYIVRTLNSSSATVARLPLREEIPIQINDHLVVEFYSKLN